MQTFNSGLISLTSFLFRGYLGLYAVGEEETTVKLTCTDVVLLAGCISVMCIRIPATDSYFRKWPVNVFRCSCVHCTLMLL